MTSMSSLKQWVRNRDRGRPGHPTQFTSVDNSDPETELDTFAQVVDEVGRLDRYRDAPFLPDEDVVRSWPSASDVSAVTPRESIPVVARYRWFGGDIWVAGFNPRAGVAFAYLDIPNLQRSGWDYVNLRNVARDRISLAERATEFVPGTPAGSCVARYEEKL